MTTLIRLLPPAPFVVDDLDAFGLLLPPPPPLPEEMIRFEGELLPDKVEGEQDRWW